ncbi:MAG TPA: tetratricopeptide repeat protein [Candidatus Latescibacteria bacterium]|nr:tetratricopeptide repeat protein [Candidatus Handelsmanbacteria bacterium]HIL09438.1 tetratricopeptide repeat protein [Candidatus Latescibacterota bacterium]
MVKTYIAMGYAHYQLNRYDEAIEYWPKAIDIDPDSDEAYFNIVSLNSI